MNQIENIIEFQDKFNCEEACWEYLVNHRWPNGFVCPRCKCHEAWFIQTRELFQCQSCRYQGSVTAGTIFHKTRTPLRKWFWAIYFVSRHKKSISANQLKKDLMVRYDVAWSMLHRIRSALNDPEGKYKLVGLIEADEAYVGGKAHGKTGRGAEKKAIVEIAVENRDKYAGRAKMKVVENASKEALTPLIEQEVKTESTVRTDSWQGYNDVESKGYKHEKVIMSSKKDQSKVLPWVHTTIGNLKNWLRGTFGHVSSKHLQYYLDEYCYRLNRRWREKELFGFTIKRCLQSKPLYYKVLTAELSV